MVLDFLFGEPKKKVLLDKVIHSNQKYVYFTENGKVYRGYRAYKSRGKAHSNDPLIAKHSKHKDIKLKKVEPVLNYSTCMTRKSSKAIGKYGVKLNPYWKAK